MSRDDDAPLMAEPPPQSIGTNLKPRNPNWGGRREGSGRKKNTMTELPEVAPRVENIEISRTYHYFCFFFLIIVKTDSSNAITASDSSSRLLCSTQPLSGPIICTASYYRDNSDIRRYRSSTRGHQSRKWFVHSIISIL